MHGMSGELRIEVLGAQGPVDLGILSGDEVIIGREPGGAPPGSITIQASSVSRQHGVFSRYRGCWVYRDLGSTNGSWVNGVAVVEGTGRVVRAGDSLQLADVAMKVLPFEGGAGSYDSAVTPGIRSILVFQRNEFLEEYPVPQYGRALAIGGARADLPLDAEVQELPALVIEGRGAAVVAFALAPGRSFSVNDVQHEVNQTVSLQDRDCVVVGSYLIMLNDPSAGLVKSAQRNTPQMRDWTANGGGGAASSSTASGTTQRLSSGRTTPRIPFGQTPPPEGSYDDPTLQVDYDSQEHQAYGRRDVRRLGGPDGPSGGEGEGIEEKVIIFIGVTLLVAVLVLIGWWAFM